MTLPCLGATLVAALAPSISTFLDHTWPTGAGGTVVAARDGKMVHCQGIGMADRERKIPARCDTVYDISSVTKQFTAAAILKLEMMGKLRVSDPMSRYIGPVPDDKRGITLHHLLTHTAGLVEALGDDYDVLSRSAMLDRALASPLKSPPGARYAYSNLGYSILAAIVEKASGMGYEQFLARHLFAPAGMTQTGYVLPRWKPGRVAMEYDRHGMPKGKPYNHPWADDGPYWNLRGNGGMLSTPRDMFRWHVTLTGDRILSRRARRKLFTPYVREEAGGSTSYGYGWVVQRVDGGTVVWHNGGNNWSFDTYARFLDTGVMVYWVSNYAYQDGKWDLSNLEAKLTLGIARRVRG